MTAPPELSTREPDEVESFGTAADDDSDGPIDDGPGAQPAESKGPGSPLWTKLLLAFGALLMVAAGGLIAAEKYAVHTATKTINKIDVPAIDQHADGSKKTHVSVTGSKTILLLGIDPRVDDNTAIDGIRPDSILMLHINAAHDQAYLVSIPRDLRVPIPAKTGPGTKHGKGTDKINSAFDWGADGLTGNAALSGGLNLMVQTIEANWGITLDAAAIVNFEGFEQVVDYIGGIRMYVDEQVKSIHIGINAQGKTVTPGMRQSADTMHVYPIPGVTPIVYNVGWHDFAGWDALDYCRQRHVMSLGDGDYGRQRHQQQFLKAVFTKIETQYVDNPIKLTGVVAKVGATLTISDGGIPLEDWVYAMKGIGLNGLTTIMTNQGKFNSTPDGRYELLSPDSQALFQSVKDDNVVDFVASHRDWVSNS